MSKHKNSKANKKKCNIYKNLLNKTLTSVLYQILNMN